MSHTHKVCPSCLDEFTLVASECQACDVALVYPDDIVETATADFPPVEQLTSVRIGPLPWTRAISEALTGAGIGHRVAPDDRSEKDGGATGRGEGRFGGEQLYGTWVRPVDLDAAKEIVLPTRFVGDQESPAPPRSSGSCRFVCARANSRSPPSVRRLE